MTVTGVWVCSVVDEHLDGPQEARLGGIVQGCRVESPDAGRPSRVAGTAIVRAGTVAQEGADIVRIVLATLVSRAGGTDPGAGGVDRRAAAGQQRSEFGMKDPASYTDRRSTSLSIVG